MLLFSIQIFLLVVFFGLFHGLVFLPVMLSLVGPSPYLTATPCKPPSSSDALPPPRAVTPEKDPEKFVVRDDGAGGEKSERISPVYNPAFVQDEVEMKPNGAAVNGHANNKVRKK